ncbi:MAG: putative DNA binding domain-containing protein, partial [Chloroflexota bacterium]|nr:putative DNA binding domain-containing protein [Chloroflexota bacterium]
MYRRDRAGRGYDRDRRDDRRDDRLVAPPREVRDDRAAERAGLHWVRVDMHLHTPASSDYRDPEGTYLKILQRAEERGLDIIALTDHNSVQGYAQMLEEIRTLEMLETRGRLNDDETRDLAEYRRLRETLLVLPGFEFTATFGFHILGLFPPGTSLRKLELLLLKLDVPEHKMLAGAPDAGPTSDVIEAYEAIHEAGGLAIAAHANSSNGVAMQGFNFGGQTKIAYTQHTALAALEVTDLDQSGRRTTESFFNGSKPEYPRRMHCIQGSDAHSIDKEPGEGANKRLGVGDRCTELLLPTPTFEAMRALFASNDFDRIRPYRPGQVAAYDFVRQARSQGPSIVQAFHERASTKTTRTRGVLKDVAAFANTSGGTIYLGVSADEAVPVRGVDSVDETVQMLRLDIQRSIVPPLEVTFSAQASEGRQIVLMQVPRGEDRPYMFETAGQIYVRQESESVPATRDDIVRLVLEAHGERITAELAAAALSVPEVESAAAAQALEEAEALSDEMVEDALSGSSVPVDLAHRRKRRRRRGGAGAAGSAVETDAQADIADDDTTDEDEPEAVAAWTTTPAWEGPEDTQATPTARAAAVAHAVADFGLTSDPAVEPAPVPETPASSASDRGRRGRGRGQRSETEVAETAATLAATQWQPESGTAPEPAAAVVAAPVVAETTQAPPLETAPEPVIEAPRVRRKGALYQVHAADRGTPELGTVLRESRAGLYADRAGELLDAALRAANPEGMFELERNHLWLPEGVEPVLPAGLTARRRSATLLNDTVLNAKSGPGGLFRSAAELAPPPAAPTPNPSP